MRHSQLPDLQQAKSALDWLATADLSIDDLEIVLPILDKFIATAQAMLSHLALLRQQRNA
jgi:hypothetical protein